VSARPAAFRWLLLAALALTLPALAGCGKKPKLLDPPEGSGPESAQFPRSYPNSKYDPVPPSQPTSQPEPMAPTTAFPPIIRPEDLGSPSTLAVPGQSGGTPWPNSSRP